MKTFKYLVNGLEVEAKFDEEDILINGGVINKYDAINKN